MGTYMKKILLLSMFVAGLTFADAEHTWRMAQEFNKEVLSEIKDDFDRNPCYIDRVLNNVFGVVCNPSKYLIELPYTWGFWKMKITELPGFVIYSKK